MLRAAAEPPRRRAGNGDHERILRAILGGVGLDRRPLDRVEAGNRIVLHNFTGPVRQKLTCSLPSCGAEFEVVLVPGQIVYPKWCPCHRTPHRRGETAAARAAS